MLVAGRIEGGGRACGWQVTLAMVPQKIFIFYSKRNQFTRKPLDSNSVKNYHASMTFLSIPFTPREVKATESRLQAIYDAAKLGLKNDSLALAAGMLPSEYRQLCQLDPVAEMAALKGKADGEREMAQVLISSAKEGDAKSALAVLQHAHAWTAKTEISVDVYQKISITQALAEAQSRIIEGIVVDTQSSESS